MRIRACDANHGEHVTSPNFTRQAIDIMHDSVRKSLRKLWWPGLFVPGVFAAGLAITVSSLQGVAIEPPAVTSTKPADAPSDKPLEKEPRAEAPRYETTIRRPSGPPTVRLLQADPQGRVGEVSCVTCHAQREPDLSNRRPADLDLFHQNMKFSHGEVACYACHNPADAGTLRLADGAAVEYADVMTLCAQCHAPQARDFAHGVHGGMTGYWDLGRGPRLRNNCIDCHDPHVPQFPHMQPTFKPRDRFLDPHAAPAKEPHGE
jgi:hypothetical protein